MNYLNRLTSKSSFWRAVHMGANGLGKVTQLFNVKPLPLQTTHIDFKSERWPQEYGPLKIAVASDFHVGCPAVSLEDLKIVVQRMNDMNADIHLLPGDFLNSHAKHNGVYIEPEKISEVLSGLEPRIGKFATLGNHDWYEDPQGMYRALCDAGFIVLENMAHKIEHENMKFWLVCASDPNSQASSFEYAFSQITDSSPVIAMCHNPSSMHLMPVKAEPVITFAGHTHGLQYKLPFMKHFIPQSADRDLTHGLVEKYGRFIHINSGVGTSIHPMRNIHPEIVDFTIFPGSEPL